MRINTTQAPFSNRSENAEKRSGPSNVHVERKRISVPSALQNVCGGNTSASPRRHHAVAAPAIIRRIGPDHLVLRIVVVIGRLAAIGCRAHIVAINNMGAERFEAALIVDVRLIRKHAAPAP